MNVIVEHIIFYLLQCIGYKNIISVNLHMVVLHHKDIGCIVPVYHFCIDMHGNNLMEADSKRILLELHCSIDLYKWLQHQLNKRKTI